MARNQGKQVTNFVQAMLLMMKAARDNKSSDLSDQERLERITGLRYDNADKARIAGILTGTSPGSAGGAKGAGGFTTAGTGGKADPATIKQAHAFFSDQLAKEGVSPANVPHAATLLTTQAIAESGLKTNTSHDGDTGYGIYGARLERNTAMQDWMAKNNFPKDSLEGQARYMAHEAMTGNYPQTKAALMGATADNAAANTHILTREFENPKVKNDRTSHIATINQALTAAPAPATVAATPNTAPVAATPTTAPVTTPTQRDGTKTPLLDVDGMTVQVGADGKGILDNQGRSTFNPKYDKTQPAGTQPKKVSANEAIPSREKTLTDPKTGAPTQVTEQKDAGSDVANLTDAATGKAVTAQENASGLANADTGQQVVTDTGNTDTAQPDTAPQQVADNTDQGLSLAEQDVLYSARGGPVAIPERPKRYDEGGPAGSETSDTADRTGSSFDGAGSSFDGAGSGFSDIASGDVQSNSIGTGYGLGDAYASDRTTGGTDGYSADSQASNAGGNDNTGGRQVNSNEDHNGYVVPETTSNAQETTTTKPPHTSPYHTDSAKLPTNPITPTKTWQYAGGGAVAVEEDDGPDDPPVPTAIPQKGAPAVAPEKPDPNTVEGTGEPGSVQGIPERAPVAAPQPAAPAQEENFPNLGKALTAGLKGVTEMFGLGDADKTAIPGSAVEAGQRRQFAKGEGAVSPADLVALQQGVDPGGQLTTQLRNVAGLHALYTHYMDTNRPDLAERAAASLLMRLRDVSAGYGKQAAQALLNGDQSLGVRLLREAYNNTPDGHDVEVGESNGTVTATLKDKDGKTIREQVVSPQMLLAAATGFADGSAYWKSLTATAARTDPKGEFTAVGKAADDAAKGKAAAAAKLEQRQYDERKPEGDEIDFGGPNVAGGANTDQTAAGAQLNKSVADRVAANQAAADAKSAEAAKAGPGPAAQAASETEKAFTKLSHDEVVDEKGNKTLVPKDIEKIRNIASQIKRYNRGMSDNIAIAMALDVTSGRTPMGRARVDGRPEDARSVEGTGNDMYRVQYKSKDGDTQPKSFIVPMNITRDIYTVAGLNKQRYAAAQADVNGKVTSAAGKKEREDKVYGTGAPLEFNPYSPTSPLM